MSMKVLVTGGAGYIGSHVVRQLGAQGYVSVVYDNCSVGSLANVPTGDMVVGDLADIEKLSYTFARFKFDAVLHFAASTVAPESIIYPLDYYQNNVCATLNLLRCCQTFKVHQLVFSSTAAVYGNAPREPVTESFPTSPISPYGKSKLMCEQIIQDYARASDLRCAILRYFNVAGAHPLMKPEHLAPKAAHLVKVVCEAAVGKRSSVKVFGADFPTKDGTGIRDYIHVDDLAAAHLLALEYLKSGGVSDIFNCGYGKGHSVREVIKTAKRLSEVDFPVIETDRRPGDPACSIASSERIRQVLGWSPRHDTLDDIVGSTLAWEQQLLQKAYLSHINQSTQESALLNTGRPHPQPFSPREKGTRIKVPLPRERDLG